ncbi:MAG: DUF1080 domain-containing protein [Sedimentisphaerales bacterium]|nr:DUF1080 domain-containing protein [Sedimentisphaerales bacterium]
METKMISLFYERPKMRKVNLNILMTVCVFLMTLTGQVAGRTLKVERNGPPYKVDCADGSAYFSSIQLAIENANDGDEIAVWPGTYYETIDFSGKAIRLYSTGGPGVTTINASGAIADNFDDRNLDGWNIVDEGNTGCPSAWSVIKVPWFDYCWMVQLSNIHMLPREAYESRGTYALWQESFHWDDYQVTFLMASGDNDMIGLMFRYRDHDNYYRFSWDRDRSRMWLGKMIDGQFTILKSKNRAYETATWYSVEIIAEGPNLTVKIDGVQELDAIDNNLAYGPIALYCWGNEETYFDEITVTKLQEQYHAIQCISGEGPDTILEGFTITGGNANGSGLDNCGGGMYCENSSPKVTDCNFSGNSADSDGGGMYNDNSSPDVIDCNFSGNDSNSHGGGMCNVRSCPKLTNCIFNGNQAGNLGGGISNSVSSNSNMTNCIFTGNLATSGGGMYNNDNSNPTVINCLFTVNSATVGGGMYNSNSSPKVTNCILWGDTPDEIYDSNSTPDVIYSDVQGGWGGIGNIDADPCFVDAAVGDFHTATPASPCVEAGNSTALGLPETDLDGNPRVMNGNWDSMAVVDMGVYEHCGPTTLLSVGILPQGALDAGAAWRLVGQTQWRDSNDIIYNLAPGYYEVEFSRLEDWTEPEILSVTVVGGAPVHEMGEYKAIALYDIGQIPPRDAPHGRKLSFYVYSEKLGPDASLLCSEPDPLPSGPVSFDIDSGLFTYEPNDFYDRTPFAVTFIATAGGDVNEQTVEIRPVPDLPPEYSIVSRPTQPFPDPCSRNYLFVNEIDLQDPGDPNTYIWFNTIRRATRSITIGGKTVVLEAGSQYYNLFDDYHNNEDIHDMTIHAETVIIRDPLCLPQTDVTIYARELSFEDDGSIDTTPLGDWLAVHNGVYNQNDGPADGNDGHPAGDINLFVGSFSAPAGGPRLIMNGGKGQDPEPGRNGENGTNVPLATGWPAVPGRPPGLTSIKAYKIYHLQEGHSCDGPYYSPDPYPGIDILTPKAGKNAIPAGKPGKGGKGGDLIATLDLSAYVQSLGGQSGNAPNDGNDYTGGVNGTPNPAYKAVLHHHVGWDDWAGVWRTLYWCWYPCPDYPSCSEKAGTTVIYWAGPTFVGSAPPADVPVAAAGKTLHRPRAFAWLSPYALKMVVAHAKDAYLYGYLVEARDILQEYYELLETYMSLAEWSELSDQWQFDFEQMHDEIGTLLHRLANGLDYFGNPPDWVPMLSFEVLEEVYRDEIDHTVQVLYLSYWLQNNAQDLTQTKEALSTGRAKLWEQTQNFRADCEAVAEIIGPLETEAAEIADRIGRADAGGCSGLLCRLKEKEAELVKKADNDVQARYELPTWKRALRACGTIIGSVSTGGSRGAAGATAGVVAGVAGGALDAAMNEFLADPDPWPQINMRTDVVKQFNSIEFDEATTGWLEDFDQIENLSDIEEEGAKSYLDRMKNDAEKMAKGLYDVKESLMNTSLSNEEVEAELKKIKAEDPQFTQLVDDVTELMVQKEVFNRQLAAAMQEVSMLSNSITNNILAIDAMNRQGSSISQILDPSVLMYVKDMERRALERLMKYHYYMAKAYEYRFLEPYEEDLKILPMFEKMEKIVSSNGTLSEADFNSLKAVYQEQLRELTEDILNRFLNDPHENNIDTPYRLSPEELNRLNAGEPVAINFVDRGLFLRGRENIRIVNMEVKDIEVATTGNPGSFGVVDIKMMHPGLSKLQYKDNIYQFRHLAHDTKEILYVTWESEWNISGEINHVKPSVAHHSLLWSLLGMFGEATDGNALIYSRVGARADIIIVKEVNSEKPCRFDINELELRIDYDYYDKDYELQTLRVRTDPNVPQGLSGYNLLPYFLVDAPDEAARQDGIGDFYRIYEHSNTRYVSITAPERYGNWRFQRWTDRQRTTTLTTNLMLITDLKPSAPPPYGRADQTVLAQYLYDGPLPHPADFNGDFSLDFTDFSSIAYAWRTKPGDAKWEERYDISEPANNIIDMHDIAAFVQDWLTNP